MRTINGLMIVIVVLIGGVGMLPVFYASGSGGSSLLGFDFRTRSWSSADRRQQPASRLIIAAAVEDIRRAVLQQPLVEHEGVRYLRLSTSGGDLLCPLPGPGERVELPRDARTKPDGRTAAERVFHLHLWPGGVADRDSPYSVRVIAQRPTDVDQREVDGLVEFQLRVYRHFDPTLDARDNLEFNLVSEAHFIVEVR